MPPTISSDGISTAKGLWFAHPTLDTQSGFTHLITTLTTLRNYQNAGTSTCVSEVTDRLISRITRELTNYH